MTKEQLFALIKELFPHATARFSGWNNTMYVKNADLDIIWENIDPKSYPFYLRTRS